MNNLSGQKNWKNSGLTGNRIQYDDRMQTVVIELIKPTGEKAILNFLIYPIVEMKMTLNIWNNIYLRIADKDV